MTDTRSISALVDVAATAVLPAGDLLAAEFRTGRVAGEYGAHDVKTEIDERAERLILDALDYHVPEHATYGEETGERGDGPYTWVIDPLDGTNNYAAGFPSFATATCCLRDDEPVAAAVYEPLPGSLYVAGQGMGARGIEAAELDTLVETGDRETETVAVEPDDSVTGNLDGPVTVDIDGPDPAGRTLAADSDTALDHGTVSFIVGLPVVRNPERRARADRLVDAVDATCKRVLQSWSPCVDWGLLARGGTEAVVSFRPDPFEQFAGSLLAAESGATIRESAELYVAAADPTVADQLYALATEHSSGG